MSEPANVFKLVPATEEPIRVAERDYVIYKRGNSKNYWMRLSIKGHGQQRYALGTDNLDEALTLAEGKYQTAIIKAQHNILEGRTSFDHLADQYVVECYAEAEANPKRTSNARYAERICKRYLKPHFGRRTVSSISAPRINTYLEWRKSYWITGLGKDEKKIEFSSYGRWRDRPVQRTIPSVNTLKRECSVLKGIFNYAVRKGHITKGEIPPIEVGVSPRKRRPHFTKQQIEKLPEAAMLRVHESSGNSKLLYERSQLMQFVEIALGTGMRPIEIFQLNWNHLEGFDPSGKAKVQDQKLVIVAYGKGKPPERSIPKSSVAGNFRVLWEAQTQRFGKTPDDSDAVFRSFKGDRIGSLKKSLNSLLDAAGLKTGPFGEVYSAYSFRHSYATWQLQKKPPMDINTLAINMRTSPAMIQKYYSHVIADDHADQLRGGDEW